MSSTAKRVGKVAVSPKSWNSLLAILVRIRRSICPARFFGKAGAHWIAGRRDRADARAHCRRDLARGVRRFPALLPSGHEGENILALDLMMAAHDRRFRDRRMRGDGAFKLDGAQTMA